MHCFNLQDVMYLGSGIYNSFHPPSKNSLLGEFTPQNDDLLTLEGHRFLLLFLYGI